MSTLTESTLASMQLTRLQPLHPLQLQATSWRCSNLDNTGSMALTLGMRVMANASRMGRAFSAPASAGSDVRSPMHVRATTACVRYLVVHPNTQVVPLKIRTHLDSLCFGRLSMISTLSLVARCARARALSAVYAQTIRRWKCLFRMHPGTQSQFLPQMVPFAGYELPVQYPAGVLQSHLHTRAKGELADVVH